MYIHMNWSYIFATYTSSELMKLCRMLRQC